MLTVIQARRDRQRVKLEQRVRANTIISWLKEKLEDGWRWENLEALIEVAEDERKEVER